MKQVIKQTRRVCVITGAGGVLCSVFARVMAEGGYSVALLDINPESAGAVADKINSAGGSARAYRADVLNRSSLEEIHAEILRDFGKCSVLINGAGGNNSRAVTSGERYLPGDIDRDGLISFFNIEQSGFDFVFDLNLMGTLLPTQVFAADMLGGSGCSIVNISSMNAYRPLTKIPAYSAAKAAVSNFTQWLAVHFAAEGIRVNAIAPGFFVTAQNRSLLYDADGNPTARTEKILSATPMGRFGRPEELAGTLLWLTDADASGFVTGVIVPVDGGFSAYSGV